MINNVGMAASLGSLLRAEVERQLLHDLTHYGVESDGAIIDWSDSCVEGHSTSLLDGTLHNFSNVGILDKSGQLLACGWVDFIHGGGTNPLFVFWDQVTVFGGLDGRRKKVLKSTPGIPKHVWEKLSETTKGLCTKATDYDSMWCNDPLVQQWIQARNDR